MIDTVSSETRSRIMAAIRGKDTKPEMTVRRHLHAAGLRYVLHDRSLPGKPDLVFPGRRLAVFVHGCFWHRHPGCRYATMPASRREFWEGKFAANVDRDRRAIEALEATGWTVITVWECETRSPQFLERLAQMVRQVPVARRGRPRRPARSHIADLDRGIERAVLDFAWGDGSVTAQAEFVARGLEGVQEACSLTFVEVRLRRSQRCRKW